jgi:hypothetical protein
MVPVPQTDSGGHVENTKAIERTLVKELGKLLPSSKRPQKPGPSDCLLKTQERAKSQDDVYALTPARCRKVTWRG